ncbi:MAG: phage tail tape measure protein, partial [Thermomicrobiales bacterium]
ATTLKQYNLAGDQASHVADILSAAAGKALGSVEYLAQGLKFVGPVAASMGVSVVETAGALALFADQGLIGEQAGTSLRGVLSSLTSPSSQAAKEIERLNINLYDGQGGFIGLAGTAQRLADAYQGLDDRSRDASLGIIFGNQQVTAARVLFAAGGDEVAKYTREVNDAGYAARVAAERLNNLRGDLEKLSGALDTALIQTGSGANDVLRSITQSVTFLVDGVGNLPTPVLTAGLAVGTLTAAVALAGGTALIAIPRFAALKNALEDINVSARSTAVGVGLVGAAIGIATLVLSAFVAEQASSKARTDSFRESLDQTTGALTEYSREVAIKALEERGAFKDAERYGITQRELTDAVVEGGDALAAVQAKLDAYSEGLSGTQKRAAAVQVENGATTIAIRKTREELAAGVEEWKNSKAATDDNSEALADLRGEAEGAGEAVSDLADLIRGFADATLSTREAERQFQAAVDDATAALAQNGATLDINTEAGRANEKALDQIAKTSKDAAVAIYEQTGSQELATQAITDGRQALIDQLAAFGIVGPEAEAYADNLGLIPSNISTVVDLDTTTAQQNLDQFIRLNNGRSVRINGTVVNGPGVATGGYISGPGTGTSDSIPARLSNGEYVVKASAVRAVGVAYLDHINNQGMVPAYATGGYVTAPPAQVSSQHVTYEINALGVDPETVTQLLVQKMRVMVR